MELREERPGDKESVRDIHLRAFGDHGLVVADLVDTLRGTITPVDGLSLVAERDGQIVGHAMLPAVCLMPLGGLARCSWPSGISESRSPRWLPAWLPVSEGLADRSADADRPLFRRSGLPVRLTKSKRGWMLLCVDGRGWLPPLLPSLLSAAQTHWIAREFREQRQARGYMWTTNQRSIRVGEGSPRRGLPGPPPHSQGTQKKGTEEHDNADEQQEQ